MDTNGYDVAVIGGGLVGLATARALSRRFPGLQLLLLEKEARVAVHQSGRNSGVIHSGIYYRPGSLKARLCVRGARLLTAFCDAHRIPYHRCGKVIVAVEPEELPRLQALYEQGKTNHVPGLAYLVPEQLREFEPSVQGLAALHLPEVAIVNYAAVAHTLAQTVEQAGGVILTSTSLISLQEERSGWHLGTTREWYRARFLINCTGLHVDRVARMAQERPSILIVPFRGEYYMLQASRASLVNGLVYPIPDPSLPFLGIHFTKTLTGEIQVGPNAVLALKREGYARTDLSWRDCLELAVHPGFWRMVRRYWKVGVTELGRSLNKQAFLRAAQRLIPALREDDLLPSVSGVRAQAVSRDGSLVDDFLLSQSRNALHVYNAPSPAATASLSIGETIADHLTDRLAVLR